jgi:lipoprotein NlpD
MKINLRFLRLPLAAFCFLLALSACTITESKFSTSALSHGKKAATVVPGVVAENKIDEIEFWLWPAKGRLIETFSPAKDGNKGIDITGTSGSPIFASSAGKIVYVGAGLKKYGRMVIIKHNDNFVSAYACNQRLLVKEGQRVTAGQKIASMGTAKQGMAILHFEIRLNGKPVDPLKYLKE